MSEHEEVVSSGGTEHTSGAEIIQSMDGHSVTSGGTEYADERSQDQTVPVAMTDEGIGHRTPMPGDDLMDDRTHALATSSGASSLGEPTGAPAPTTHPLTAVRDNATALIGAIDQINGDVRSEMAKLDVRRAVLQIEHMFQDTRG